MNIESETLDGGIVKIALKGRMDIDGAMAIDLKFNGYAATQRSIIVDMTAVEFLASMGIRSLLLVAKAVNGRGGKLVLFNPDTGVSKVLETSGVARLIPICRSLDDARRSVAV